MPRELVGGMGMGKPRRPSDWDAPSAMYSCAAAPLPHHGSSSSSNPAPFLQRGSVVDRLSIGPHCRWDDDVVSEGPQGMEANLSSEGGLMHERMPRYRTCPAFSSGDIDAPYGLPIPSTTAGYHESDGHAAAREDDMYLRQLAYLVDAVVDDRGWHGGGEVICSVRLTPWNELLPERFVELCTHKK